MFDLKRKLAFLAVPGAALALVGGVAVAHASTAPPPSNPVQSPAVVAAEVPDPAESPGAVEAPDVAGAADAAGGHDDTGVNADHQFDGQE